MGQFSKRSRWGQFSKGSRWDDQYFLKGDEVDEMFIHVLDPRAGRSRSLVPLLRGDNLSPRPK